MKKILPILLAALVLCGCSSPASPPPVYTIPETVSSAETTVVLEPTTVPQITEETTLPETEPQPEVFTLTFVGDCTLGSNPNNWGADVGFIKVIGEDYGFPFRNVQAYFATDDGTFANLEGPLTDEGYPANKTHVFRGPTAYVDILTQGSVEVVSLANNHTLDYGHTGYLSTLATLDGAGIPYVERDSSTLVTLLCGLTVGLYGAVYYKIDQQDMVQQIQSLRQQGAELVIVAPHWGRENSYRISQEQEDVAHAAIEAGADIVWGSHPHVLQPIERYEEGLILYSMGNFSFGGFCSPKDLDTAVVQQQVIRYPDGTVALGEYTVIPCSLGSVENTNNFQPTPYPQDSQGYQRVMEKISGTYKYASVP